MQALIQLLVKFVPKELAIKIAKAVAAILIAEGAAVAADYLKAKHNINISPKALEALRSMLS